MSITVEVTLLSGRTIALAADADESLTTLKRRAETSLGAGMGRLVRSSGSILNTMFTVKRAKFQQGEVLTLQVGKVEIQANPAAGAAILIKRWFRTILGSCHVWWRQQRNATPSAQRAADPMHRASFC